MIKLKKIFLITLLTLLSIVMFTYISFANAAEPPSIMIIVPHPPSSLEISMSSGNQYFPAQVIDKGIEKYYVFYLREVKVSDHFIHIKAENHSFKILVAESAKSYANVYSLNLEKQVLEPGKSLSRSILLVTQRLTVTLILEAFVFYLMGYREKRSWMVFLGINCLTQGALNIWLNGFFPMQSYLILTLILGEIFVYLAELILFTSWLQEHRQRRAVLFVLLANSLSLVFGGYVIACLPI